ncbi:hypothetical protein [Gemmata sp.]|uniref:hypothetical protein n=1 Tax=Gemmata sp. TaxID=1914242 RepID=UPI003F7211CD
MGTTFAGIGDRGFWMRDSILELWLRFLALHVEDPVESGSLAASIRDQWLLASRGFFTGCVPEGLEEAVATPEGDKLVRGAIVSLLETLRSAPPHLSKGVLNLMGFTGGAFNADIETWRLVEIGEAYLGLLDGKVGAGPSDTSFMPGCGQQRQAEPGAAPAGWA